MSLHTVDPTTDAAEAAIRALLETHDAKPIRYEDANGAVSNTTACRGLVAWYVLIEATRSEPWTGVWVGAVRLGLVHRDFTTRQWLTPPVSVTCLDGADDTFADALALHIGAALYDIDKAQASRG